MQAVRQERECLWCGGSPRGDERAPGGVRCSICGVVTPSPAPTPQQLEDAYAGPYRPDSGRFSGLGDAILRRSRAGLADRLDQIAPPGRVLDVGAGEGALVDALRRAGRETVGLERSPRRSDLVDAELEAVDGDWAAIVFWHSLEHLPRPAQALEQAAALLVPGGVVVVAVPNSASLQARIFGERWFALDPPRHLIHLTGAALRARFRDLGLRVERVSYVRGGQVVFGWLEGMVASLPGAPSLYDAIRRPEARFAPLGPGRRAAALIAALVLWPFALAAASLEVLARRGGTVYIEARAA